MFLPFIPYFVMLAGLTALLAAPPLSGGGNGVERVLAAGSWELLLGYGALVLIGGLVGNLPARWTGRSAQGTGFRQRAIFMVVWLWAVALSDLHHALAGRFEGLAGGAITGGEAALAALMVNFWLAEALSLDPYNPWHRGTYRAQLRHLGWRLRLPAPILVVILAGMVIPPLVIHFAFFGASDTLFGNGLSVLAPLLIMVLVAGMAVPLLMRVCWGLQPLAEGAVSSAIHDELRANRVKVARVLAWPDQMMGFSTAGVVGILPHFRYLLFSPLLAAQLTEAEIRAVTAHEAGHLRHGHLWYLMLALLGFVMFAQAVTTGVLWNGLMTGAEVPLWVLISGEVLTLLLFLRFGVGFLSRNFERQADAQAVRRTGAEPLAAALVKLAHLNGMPIGRDNWHHYGIVQRVAFARGEADGSGKPMGRAAKFNDAKFNAASFNGANSNTEPTTATPDATSPENAGLEEPMARLARHDRRVATLKVGVVVFFVLAMGFHFLLSSESAAVFVGERVLAERLEGVTQPGPEHLDAARILASRAHARKDFRKAEYYFRLILSVNPDDPQAQNNLAWVLVTRPLAENDALREGLRLAKASAQATGQAYVLDTLAESYFQLGRMNEARDAALRALAQAEAEEGRGNVPLSYYRERLAQFSSER